MVHLPAYKMVPLGDSALIIDFGNIISRPVNDAVVSIFKKIQQSPIEGMIEAVPAYSSLAVYYDVLSLRKKITDEQTVFQLMKNKMIDLLQEENEPLFINEKKEISIPVCYEKEFATDLKWMSLQINIPADEIIQLHTSTTYHVFMLGFLPGFAYMGEVPDKIAVPRKPQPVQVAAGSVGIAGKQTGVYPFSSPGGWQIIGRTPVKFFDKEKKEPTLLKAGDSVQFYSISKDEFENIKSRHS